MIAIVATALTVDVGALYLERRHAQATADLAALAAAGDLAHAQAAALATLKANGITTARDVVVETGRYQEDAALAPGQRFKAGGTPANAARVTFKEPGKLYFAKAFVSDDCCTIGVTALGTAQQLATFSIGSRLASLREGVVNNVLGGLLGGNINLSAMDYNALAAADVSLLDFSQALATQLSLRGVTYDQLVNANASVGDIISALLTVAEAKGSTQAVSALRLLRSQSNASAHSVPLSSLLDFGRLDDKVVGTAVPGTFKMMDLLSGAATLANGGHMVSVNLGASIPGITSLKIDIAIGEPPQSSPWAAVGERDATVRTAQTRVRIVAEVPGLGLLLGTKLRLPLYLDVAYAKGRLSQIACAGDGQGDVTVGVTPGIAAAAIGEVTDSQMTTFNSDALVTDAKIAQTSLKLLLLQANLNVRGTAFVTVGNTRETSVTFTRSDIANGVMKSVSTNSLAESLVTSLLRNLSLTVELTPLVITTPSAVTALVADTLGGVAAPLDAVVFNLLNTLGVHLGEADVRVNGVLCRGAVLAG